MVTGTTDTGQHLPANLVQICVDVLRLISYSLWLVQSVALCIMCVACASLLLARLRSPLCDLS